MVVYVHPLGLFSLLLRSETRLNLQSDPLIRGRAVVRNPRVQGLGFASRGLGIGVQGLGLRIQGLGFASRGSAIGVQGLGLRIQGFGSGV